MALRTDLQAAELRALPGCHSPTTHVRRRVGLGPRPAHLETNEARWPDAQPRATPPRSRILQGCGTTGCEGFDGRRVTNQPRDEEMCYSTMPQKTRSAPSNNSNTTAKARATAGRGGSEWGGIGVYRRGSMMRHKRNYAIGTLLASATDRVLLSPPAMHDNNGETAGGTMLQKPHTQKHQMRFPGHTWSTPQAGPPIAKIAYLSPLHRLRGDDDVALGPLWGQ